MTRTTIASLRSAAFAAAMAVSGVAMARIEVKAAQPHPYVGIWVTADGHIRHELLPNGRYDEARGSHIDYWDDTGFTADGTFVDENTLHHGGMIFRRRPAS